MFAIKKDLLSRSLFTWSGWQDLNPRPTGPKPVALPSCATPRNVIIYLYMAGVVGLEPTAHGFGDRCSTN